MPRYRKLDNDPYINVDGVRIWAGDDGWFDVESGSRAEQVLLAGGAVSDTAAGGFTVASQAEAEAGTDNTKGMTPLRVAQAVEAMSPDDIRTFDINGAGTYILALGAGSLLSILLTSAATASPGLTGYDNTAASGPLVLAATNVTSGSMVPITVGTPNVGSPFATGLCLVVAGAQVGRVTVRLGS